MTRLFVGIEIPDHVTQKCSALKTDIPGIRWQKPENFHITITFIGEVETEEVVRVESSLRAVLAKSFRLSLSDIGLFYRKREPKVLRADIVEEEALFELKDKVDAALATAGLSLDKKKYTPHMTLAFLKKVDKNKLRPFLEKNRGIAISSSFDVREFILYQSVGTPVGKIYKAISAYSLSS